MDILQIGPWVLLVIGAGILILAVFNSINHGITKGRFLIWIFGFALCGVGIYGPGFFSSYASFIQTISGLYPVPTIKTADEALMKIGRGGLSPQFSDISAQYIICHPPDGIDSVLDRAISAAVDQGGKKILLNAKILLSRIRTGATLVRKSLQNNDGANALFDSLDPVMQTMVAEDIIKLPDSVRKSVGIDQNKLSLVKSKKTLPLKGRLFSP